MTLLEAAREMLAQLEAMPYTEKDREYRDRCMKDWGEAISAATPDDPTPEKQ